MNRLLFSTPRTKILIALALLLVLGGASTLSGLSLALGARVLLLISAAAVIAFWFQRSRKRTGFALPERLQVLSRTGLSQRCGLALVEADGEAFLVAFGDGFATIRPARRAKSRRASSSLRVVEGGAR